MSKKSQSSEVAGKNIRKLRVVSGVCSLAKSWQQWVSENESKQASEPSGWCPSASKEPEEKPSWRTCAGSKKQDCPTSLPPAPSQDSPASAQPLEEASRNVPEASRIKTKQVVKSVTSGAQERSVGIGVLANRYSKCPVDDVDRVLSARMSPTRRRRCSNLVSDLTKGWKEVEKGKRAKEEAHGLGGDVRSCSVDTEDSGFSELEERSLETDAGPAVKAQADPYQKPSVNRQKQRDHVIKDTADTIPDSWVRIKRPSKTLVNRDADETKKLSVHSKKFSPVGNLKSKWQSWASEHTVNQKLNPFSDEFDYELSMSLRLHKGQEGYGRPKEGSKTAERARRAEAHIHREIDDMCFIIRTMADPDSDGHTRITFGELFDRYVRISDKVVGILMRARKHGKVAFDGEMLWQGRDDHVIITLLV